VATDTAMLAVMKAATSGQTDVGPADELGVTAEDVRILRKLGLNVILAHGRLLLGMPPWRGVTQGGREVTVLSRFENGDWYVRGGQRYARLTPLEDG
jgi:hypothetical protein